jgi:hypothetical protein
LTHLLEVPGIGETLAGAPASLVTGLSGVQPLFRPPPLIRSILRFVTWLVLAVLGMVVIAIVVASGFRIGMMLGSFLFQTLLTQVGGTVLDTIGLTLMGPVHVIKSVVKPVVTLLLGPDNDPGSELPPVGALGDAATVHWEIRDNLVLVTEATAQAVQPLVQRCDKDQAPTLQLTPAIGVACDQFRSQLDHRPSVSTLHRRAQGLQTAVNKELADEFNDYAQFLHLLRDYPAAKALNPRMPRLGFESAWDAIPHKLDDIHRTVWRRWILGQPKSTLMRRQNQLARLVEDSLRHRDRLLSELSTLEDDFRNKFSGNCAACALIEGQARALDPASFLSYLSETLNAYQGGLGSSAPEAGTTGRK